MSDSNFQQLKHQLLSRRVSGEISEDEYVKLLSEIERHESSTGNTVGNAEADTNQPDLGRHHSVGQWVTGAAPASVVAPGEKIDSFVLEERLGRGGMGEVWKARDTVGDRDVVLKMLPPELLTNEDEKARIKKTFQQVHRLNHQNICPTYSIGEHPQLGFYLVLKFLDGGTLNSYRRRVEARKGKFTLSDAARVLTAIASALDHAHGEKVIHRDVKPENIMVSDDGKQIHLVDFGLAAEVRTSMARATKVQIDNSGTYPYMAPEQWRARPQGPRTDQYALGVVAYELLADRLPFESADVNILMRAALEEMPAPISDQSNHVNQVLLKALSKDSKDRFKTCGEFVRELLGKRVKAKATSREGDENRSKQEFHEAPVEKSSRMPPTKDKAHRSSSETKKPPIKTPGVKPPEVPVDATPIDAIPTDATPTDASPPPKIVPQQKPARQPQVNDSKRVNRANSTPDSASVPALSLEENRRLSHELGSMYLQRKRQGLFGPTPDGIEKQLDSIAKRHPEQVAAWGGVNALKQPDVLGFLIAASRLGKLQAVNPRREYLKALIKRLVRVNKILSKGATFSYWLSYAIASFIVFVMCSGIGAFSFAQGGGEGEFYGVIFLIVANLFLVIRMIVIPVVFALRRSKKKTVLTAKRDEIIMEIAQAFPVDVAEWGGISSLDNVKYVKLLNKSIPDVVLK